MSISLNKKQMKPQLTMSSSSEEDQKAVILSDIGKLSKQSTSKKLLFNCDKCKKQYGRIDHYIKHVKKCNMKKINKKLNKKINKKLNRKINQKLNRKLNKKK